MDVRSFMLTTGQELIADLVKETGGGYLIRSPLVVHVIKGAGGEGHLAFAQWSMIHDDTEMVHLYDHALVAMPVKPLAAVAHSYEEQITGLSLPAPPSTRILQG